VRDAWSAWPRCSAESVPTRFALALAPLGFLELDPPTLISVAGAAGFRFVTLRTAPAVPGGVHYPLWPGSSELREAAARLDDTGVAVLQVELVSLHRETDVPGVRPLLESGAELGATRVVVSGDDADLSVVSARLAEVAELAAEYEITVDVEFMPFRELGTLGRALDVVAAAGRDGVAVMVDALHLARSGGGPADVASADPRRLRVLQICDAPLAAPAPELLATEAREGRLLPGAGALPLDALLTAMPDDAVWAGEVPMSGSRLSPFERAQAIFEATARLVERRRQRPV
jgi:sugar phosphate isomerase/epimerase